MNNEEKKKFVINAHKLFMDYQPYANNYDLNELRKKEDEFWNVYYNRFCSYFPKSLYKYRKPVKSSFENLENDTAWFSHPKKFDDTMDSTINNDIEKEIADFEANPSKMMIELSKALIGAFAREYKVEINLSEVDTVFPLFNSDGTLNEDATKKYLSKKMPKYATDECIKKLKKSTSIKISKEVKKSVYGFLKCFMKQNERIRKEALVFSLAEDCDNQAMWGLYAAESRGFCIEYSFPQEDLLGQRMILNLFPVIYGQKKEINFFDLLIRGLNSYKKVNGITYEDFQELFLSTLTKDPDYEFQREWRIVFDKRLGSNLQEFPFAKSIIMGERISKKNSERLIEIAKTKHLSVYQRKINKTNSNITMVKVL